MADFYSKSVQETLDELKSSTLGLTEKEAQLRLKRDGQNIFFEEKKKSFPRKILSQLADFSIIILLAAAAASAAISVISRENDFTDPLVILAIVIINAVIGALQESKAEKSLEALKKMSSPESLVKRDGVFKKIPSEEVVVGDIISIKSGDMICADARLLSDSAFTCDESALTGESLPSEKNSSLLLPKKTAVAEQANLVFASTLASTGHATAVVTATAKATEIGKIAGMLGEKSEETPLQKRLSRLSKILGWGAIACCAVIFVIGVIRKNSPLQSLMLAISLAVAAIPEGLPAIVTIVLSRGVGKLSGEGAVIRRLPSCETLGNATYICSDKTGTLTKNKMTVTEVRLPFKAPLAPESRDCREILKYAALCTDCEITKKRSKQAVTGTPTEKAIVEAAVKNGCDILNENVVYKRIKEIPFTSERKMMTTVLRAQNDYITVTKGAPQYVIKRCKYFYNGNVKRALNPAEARSLLNSNDDMAEGGLRVIAVAFKEHSSILKDIESELTFLGLIGLEDPPRKEAKTAVKKCKEAGITPVMITGDQLITAKVVAKKLGIYEYGDLSLEGSELDAISDEEFKKTVKNVKVYARVTPEHKMRIVKALKECGETVAMTGDGVNDAPALKCADIGCAMGKSGTDVAKNAADLILTDDNFSTIVNAVAIGRGLFDNIKKSVRFLLSCNIGEIMLIFFSSLLGLPSPLLPVQLLWLNLITDSLPAMALGAERPEKDIMKRKPLQKSEGLITREKAFDIILEGLLFGGISLFAFTLGKNLYSIEAARSMTFCTLSIAEIFHSFNVRTERSVFSVSPFENPKLLLSTVVCTSLQILAVSVPYFNKILSSVPLTKEQWLITSALCLLPLVVTELEKLTNKIKESHHNKKARTDKTKKETE